MLGNIFITIVNYTIHQNITDSNTLIKHLEDYKKSYNTIPTLEAGLLFLNQTLRKESVINAAFLTIQS